MTNNRLSDGAEERAPDSRAAMAAHHDEVAGSILEELEDLHADQPRTSVGADDDEVEVGIAVEQRVDPIAGRSALHRILRKPMLRIGATALPAPRVPCAGNRATSAPARGSAQILRRLVGSCRAPLSRQ
jgi:hypothetical protein